MRKLITAIALLLLISSFAATERAYDCVYDNYGAMVRQDTTKKDIYLIFSADSAFEGAPLALDALKSRGIHGNFFLTGNYLERPENAETIHRIIADGHYLGGHSMRHLLLAEWDAQRTPSVTTDSLLADVRANIKTLEKFGIEANDCQWFLPPFEWISATQSAVLTDTLDLKIINITPGIQIYRDYTAPADPNYLSSDTILRQLFEYERARGLNGAFLILHLGTDPARTDKLYRHLPHLLDTLPTLGYHFRRLP